MKRVILVILILALIPTAALAAPQTIDLETMSVEELTAFDKTIHAAITNASAEVVDGYILVADYNEYARNADAHSGEKIRFNGEVVQEIDDDATAAFRIAVGGKSDNIFYVTIEKTEESSRVLEKDRVTVLGTFNGLFSYQSTFGGKITVPSCVADTIVDEIVEDSEYAATRQDPAPVGATIRYNGSEYQNKAVTDVTVTKVIRGDSAASMIKSFNRYNDKPKKGNEYIIAYVTTKAISSADDKAAEIDEYDFTFTSSDGIEYDRPYVSGKTPELKSIYPGAENTGIVIAEIKQGDTPMLVYLKSADKPMWFDLNKRKPIVLPEDAIINPLKKGDKGAEVQTMQEMLAEMGYLKVTPDGNYGSKSVEAVKAYQKAMGIEITGQADEATLRMILTMQMP